MKRIHRIYIGFFVIIIAFILVYAIALIICWLKAREIIERIKETFESIIPKLEHSHYKKLSFPTKSIAQRAVVKDIKLPKYNPEIARLLSNCCLCAYNLSSSFESSLPPYIRLIKQISTNGYLLSLSDRVYIIAYRGTHSKEDVLTDLDSAQMPMTGNWFSSDETNGVMVHRGFFGMWKKDANKLKTVVDEYNLDEPGNIIYICGHSLGCATACFTALDLANNLKKSTIALYMFAPPRLGNESFVKSLEKHVPNYWAIINQSDIVPYLPPVTFSTFGSMWIYDNFKNVVFIDFQLNSMIDNHHLKYYVSYLEGCDKLKANGAAWCRPPLTFSPL